MIMKIKFVPARSYRHFSFSMPFQKSSHYRSIKMQIQKHSVIYKRINMLFQSPYLEPSM